MAGPFTRLTPSPLAATSFVDTAGGALPFTWFAPSNSKPAPAAPITIPARACSPVSAVSPPLLPPPMARWPPLLRRRRHRPDQQSGNTGDRDHHAHQQLALSLPMMRKAARRKPAVLLYARIRLDRITAVSPFPSKDKPKSRAQQGLIACPIQVDHPVVPDVTGVAENPEVVVQPKLQPHAPVSVPAPKRIKPAQPPANT